jgi:lipopolysaccharide/colanic/teichoic acid biosynthesis glycosyltransferase
MKNADESTPPVLIDRPPVTRGKDGIPRPVEAGLAFVGLIAAAPLIGLAALAVLLTSPGGAFFRQERVGRKGRVFTLHKLRTMCAAQATGPQVTAGNDRRVTCVGRLLRAAKLDELPQLWNVLKGEMSLVGPRPEVARYVDLQDPRWQVILQARPGLTDPVTLALRNEERLLAEVEGDVELFYLRTLQPIKLQGYLDYLRARDWKEDLKILLKTAAAVARPDAEAQRLAVPASESKAGDGA